MLRGKTYWTPTGSGYKFLCMNNYTKTHMDFAGFCTSGPSDAKLGGS